MGRCSRRQRRLPTERSAAIATAATIALVTTPANSGEDALAYCHNSDYAANVELAEALAPKESRPAPAADMDKVYTPGQHSIEEVCAFLKIDPSRTVKTLIVEGNDGPVALLLRGDHQLNEVKAAKLEQLPDEVRLAPDAAVREVAGAAPGSVGPVGLNIPVLADRALMNLADFVCGANDTGFHYTGVNFGRDLPEPLFVDIRNVVTGDPSPDGKGKLDQPDILSGYTIFLDRDGTLNPDRGYIRSSNQFELFPGVAQALSRLKQAGARLIVVTNQSGVARGFFSAGDLDAIHAKLRYLLGEAGVSLDAIYVCSHHPDDGCDCRKPNRGLIDRAVDEQRIDLSRSYLIGDHARDIELAKRVGSRSIFDDGSRSSGTGGRDEGVGADP